MLKRIVVIAVMCVLITPSGPTVNVGVTHGLHRIRMHDPVPENREISIKMARNEYEPFQLVIKSDNPVEITVSVTDLYDEEKNQFSKKNFALFEAHYIYVEEPTPRSKFPPDWYPDGLSPLEKITTTHKNTVVWGEVYAPENQEPGTYTGALYVHTGSTSKIVIPVVVKVWDFALPQKSSLKSGIEVIVEYVIEAHDTGWEPEELNPVLYSYYETLIEHRVMPWELYFAEPEVERDGSANMEENHEHLKYFMDELHITSLMYPLYEDWPYKDPFGKDLEKTTTYLQSLYEYYCENGWEDRFFFHFIDEPDSSQEYEAVRHVSRALEKIQPGIKFMVTEQMVPDDPLWGDLYGYVDIWCPIFYSIEDEKELIKERQALGEQVWTYTALTQGERETPFWGLDFPVINYRVVTWMIWNSHISGLIYWTCNWWEEVDNPWEEVGKWIEDEEVYNGEGVLVYPGSNQCLPSIRLKVLREGMEDYEYFVLLKSLGKESFAEEQVYKIAKSWYEWDSSPESLLKIREILAEEISTTLASSEGLQETTEKGTNEEKEEIEEKEEKDTEEYGSQTEELKVQEDEDKVEGEDDQYSGEFTDYPFCWGGAVLGLIGLVSVLFLLKRHARKG